MRITEKNSKWSEYRVIVLTRKKLNEQLSKLLASWKEIYSGSLKEKASEYYLKKNTDNYLNSRLWYGFKNDSNTKSKKREVIYNGIIMRSQFEADSALVLDELGIDYKYEVALACGYKTYYPDISLHLPEYNRCGFLETMGMMESNSYKTHNARKINDYFDLGIYPNRDIAYVSADDKYRPDIVIIKMAIAIVISSIAKQYVVKKS